LNDDVPRYGVVGHPVAHSLSPDIHAAFAREVGLAIDYRRVLAPRDGLAAAIDDFFADHGRGLNVTLPFKREAFAACGAAVSARARRAGAVNWLRYDNEGLTGDNTDGIGLVRDLDRLLGGSDRLSGARLLLIGAGGAARGVIGPLLDAGLRRLVVVNRDPGKAHTLAEAFAGAPIEARGFDALGEELFDLVVNATSAGIAGHALPLPAAVFTNVRLAYDMMYAATPTRFLVDARTAGAEVVADGLGMLVEQAAESFRLWHGVMPQTEPVLRRLRPVPRA
jgi:shikimate dehydrogenase